MNIPEPIAQFIVDNFLLSVAIAFFLGVQIIFFFNWIVKKIFCKKTTPNLYAPREEPLSKIQPSLKEASTGGVTSPTPPVEKPKWELNDEGDWEVKG